MILPYNKSPQESLYYIGYVILKTLKNIKGKKSYVDRLFIEITKTEDINFKTFVLSLDWLFLIDSIKINENGEISCI